MSDTEHECVFVEEQEPSGRLILPPCIVCGTTAMDALWRLREEISVREGRADGLEVEIAELEAALSKCRDMRPEGDA